MKKLTLTILITAISMAVMGENINFISISEDAYDNNTGSWRKSGKSGTTIQFNFDFNALIIYDTLTKAYVFTGCKEEDYKGLQVLTIDAVDRYGKKIGIILFSNKDNTEFYLYLHSASVEYAYTMILQK